MWIAAACHQPTGFATCFEDERHTRSQPPPPILCCPGQLALIGRTKGARRIGERLKTQRPEHRFVPDHGTPDVKLHIAPAWARQVDSPTNLKSSSQFCHGTRFPRKNIGPSALILHLRRVRLPLDDLFNAKPRHFQVLSVCRWLKEKEIH